MEKLEPILAVMTPTQARRWQLRLQGKSLREIAEIEGVAYQVIQKSLRLGREKAKKILDIGV